MGCGKLVEFSPLYRDQPIRMRDGVSLLADIYLPPGGGPWPVLLTRTAYDKASAFQVEFIPSLGISTALKHGFVVCVQDVRGRGASKGDSTPFVHETLDGIDTLEWLANQDFCNGKIVTFGASYVGATQWMAAAGKSPWLKAIMPSLSMDHYRKDWFFKEGAFRHSFAVLWAIESLLPAELEGRTALDEPEQDDRLREALDVMSKDPSAVFRQIPAITPEIEELAPYISQWARRPLHDEDWEAIEPVSLMPHLSVPGLHIIGVNDLFCEGGLDAYRRATASEAPCPDRQYLVLGPWSHGNYSDWQGDKWLGYEAAAAGVGLQEVQLEFASAITEDRNPDLPLVQYFVSGINQWQTAQTWPPQNVKEKVLNLWPDNRLRVEAPAESASVSFTACPLNPTPTVGGPNFVPGLLMGKNSGPKLQDSILERDDVISFVSDILNEDVLVTGKVVLKLTGSCDQADCDWVTKICDVDADGKTTVITSGNVRTRYRNDKDDPVPPGIKVNIEVPVGTVSHSFAKGHHIQLLITGADFPALDRNSHTLVNPMFATEDDLVPAVQTIWLGEGASGSLYLPVSF